MPHDAALYADSVKQRTSPAEQDAANAAEVVAAQAVYASAQDAARADYLILTDQVGAPDVDEEPEPEPDDIPTSSTLKVDIVAWLLAHGVDLDEGALDNLNKSELLALVQALLDDD